MTEDLSTPGLDVFPEYRNLADLFREETNGIPQELWEWKLPEKSWGAWSIKEANPSYRMDTLSIFPGILAGRFISGFFAAG